MEAEKQANQQQKEQRTGEYIKANRGGEEEKDESQLLEPKKILEIYDNGH